jgi:hypothetical protein
MPAARRFRDLIQLYEAEIGGEMSEVERGLIKQAAALTMTAERMQADIINGLPVDSDALIRLTSTAKRVLGAISAKADKRQAASGKDPLAAHIAAKYGRRSDASPEVDIEDDESEEADDAEGIAAAAE